MSSSAGAKKAAKGVARAVAKGVAKGTARKAAKTAGRAVRRSPGRRAPEPSPPAIPSMISIGYGNLVAVARVIAIVSPQSSPMRRLREQAGKQGKLVDATEGRRTRSILVTDSDHVILSAINPETIAARLMPEDPEGRGS